MRGRAVRSAVVLALAAWLTGCAAARVAESPPALDEFTGVLVIGVRTNWRPRGDERLQVQYTSVSRGAFASTRTLAIDAPGALEVVVVPAGLYRVARVTVGTGQMALSTPLVFRIEPNSLTYVGDLDLAFMAADQVAFSVADRPEEAVQQLRRSHPELLQRYPLVKRLIRDASATP